MNRIRISDYLEGLPNRRADDYFLKVGGKGWAAQIVLEHIGGIA
jgi:hypothetical protein